MLLRYAGYGALVDTSDAISSAAAAACIDRATQQLAWSDPSPNPPRGSCVTAPDGEGVLLGFGL